MLYSTLSSPFPSRVCGGGLPASPRPRIHSFSVDAHSENLTGREPTNPPVPSRPRLRLHRARARLPKNPTGNLREPIGNHREPQGNYFLRNPFGGREGPRASLPLLGGWGGPTSEGRQTTPMLLPLPLLSSRRPFFIDSTTRDFYSPRFAGLGSTIPLSQNRRAGGYRSSRGQREARKRRGKR